LLTISVIIPVLNENKHLSVLVPFLEKNSFIDEIIIVEASQNICSYTTDAKKVRIVTSSSTQRAKQLNEGAKASVCSILCFVHADVIPHPDSFTAIKMTIQKGIPFGYFAYQFVPNHFLLRINARFTYKKGVFSGGGDQIHFMKKESFYSLGGYDEKFVIMEDFEFIRRIKKQKLPYEIIPLPAKVSSRKYRQNSYFKVNFTNLIAFTLFFLRINSKWIKKWCQFMLK